MKKVSIHLVLWNGAKYLPFVMQSLDAQTYKNFHILIIDNGSTDNAMEWLRSHYPHIPVVRHRENIGFARAHNQAFQWTNSAYALLLNQDVILEAQYLEELVSFMDTHTNAGASQGKLFQWNFSQTLSAYETMINISQFGKTNLIDTLGLKLHPNHQVTELGRGSVSEEVSFIEPIHVFGLSATAVLYRRSAISDCAIPIPNRFPNESGMQSKAVYEIFDEDFYIYKEDVDLSYRLNLFDWGSYMVPSAHAYHDRSAAHDGANTIRAHRAERKKRPYFIRYHSAKNHILFLFKNVPSIIFLQYGWRIVLYELKKLLYITLFEPKTLKAYLHSMEKLPRVLAKRKYIHGMKTRHSVAAIRAWICRA